MEGTVRDHFHKFDIKQSFARPLLPVVSFFVSEPVNIRPSLTISLADLCVTVLEISRERFVEGLTSYI